MQTTVISLRRKRGQPRPLCQILIDRTTVFGNPFLIGRDGDREQVLAKYKEYFYRRLTNDPEFKKKVLELKGKILLVVMLGCQKVILLFLPRLQLTEPVKKYYWLNLFSSFHILSLISAFGFKGLFFGFSLIY